MSSLLDQFCPQVHFAPITAAAYDPQSGVLATGDATGHVALTRAGEATPGLRFRHGEAQVGALAVVRGGTLVAVGDDEGAISVYQVADGGLRFDERRDGARGRVRAMRGVAVSPEGGRLAAVSADGLVRMWSLETNRREVAWQGFGGRSVAFDARGHRLLCVDADGQPRLIDLLANQAVPMDPLQIPADQALFALGGTLVVAGGAGGLGLLRVADGKLVASYAGKGGSGLLAVVLSPDGAQVAAVSQRSVHVFALPDLQPVESRPHGTPTPTGAAWWTADGLRLGGEDGLAHGEGEGSVAPVTGAGGFGDWRVAVHGAEVAIWHVDRRLQRFHNPEPVREVQVDRDGRYLLALGEAGSVVVHDTRTGARLLDGGRSVPGGVAVGGRVVAALRPQGGAQWWDLARNQSWSLDWPTALGLSHGGTWLAVVNAEGRVRVLDPSNARAAIPDPVPTGDEPARLLSFVNRRPDLLVVDAEHILSHYDLEASFRNNVPGTPRDVLQFGSAPDRVWGITGGKLAAVRLPEGTTCTILIVDLGAQTVVYEVTGLHPASWVDAESGNVLEPGRGAALLEREIDGTEKRVLRALPGDQWICFSKRGVLDASERMSPALARR